MESPTVLGLLKQAIDPEKCSVAGVFPRDWLTMDRFARFPACCIVNTDKATQPGKHWVAFYLRTPNEFEFFDSYGLHPSLYQFDELWSNPIEHNPVSLQSDFSNTCAHFCLYFLHAKTLSFPMSTIVRSFSPVNLIWNDKLVRKFVRKLSGSRSFVKSPSIPNTSSQVSIMKRFAKSFY